MYETNWAIDHIAINQDDDIGLPCLFLDISESVQWHISDRSEWCYPVLRGGGQDERRHQLLRQSWQVRAGPCFTKSAINGKLQ